MEVRCWAVRDERTFQGFTVKDGMIGRGVGSSVGRYSTHAFEDEFGGVFASHSNKRQRYYSPLVKEGLF